MIHVEVKDGIPGLEFVTISMTREDAAKLHNELVELQDNAGTTNEEPGAVSKLVQRMFDAMRVP